MYVRGDFLAFNQTFLLSSSRLEVPDVRIMVISFSGLHLPIDPVLAKARREKLWRERHGHHKVG